MNRSDAGNAQLVVVPGPGYRVVLAGIEKRRSKQLTGVLVLR